MNKTKKKQKTIEELLEEALVPKEEQPYEVPGNWVWVRLGELCTIKTGRLNANAANENGIYPFFTCAKDIFKINDYAFDGEAILVTGNGDFNVKYYNGKFNAYQRTYVLQNFNCDGKYLFLYLKSTLDILTSNNRGSTIKYIRLGDLQNHFVNLPPLNEQKRIADKVEHLLNKIDEAKRLIEEAKETFEHRRAAILDKAFRGELTARWRENTDSLATADQLLNKIGGKKDMKNDPLDGEVLSNLFNLPKGWKWVRLNDLIESSTYGTSSKTNDNIEGVPVIRMGNIFDGKIILDNLKYLPNDHSDIMKLDLEENDLLFNRTNSYELVGKTAIVNREIAGKMTFASYLIRVRLLYKEILANYVCHYINSHIGRTMLMTMVTQQVGQANINSKKLAALPIPLPPEKEIKEISNILNDFLQKEKRTLNIMTLDGNVENLKQSVLYQAFRGELGTNDPSEESVIELLKAVLEEKA
ncbi:restriction endonuclease subunit S [Siminovitchia fortis]|uniref:restriction endonuclease subunit S n=1 Tax=Siminovitchia fortis TaxID=254758 RepID=UPI0011A715C3|nr:restriction endonuclease subunit S [Siminovitchia fortis]